VTQIYCLFRISQSLISFLLPNSFFSLVSFFISFLLLRFLLSAFIICIHQIILRNLIMVAYFEIWFLSLKIQFHTRTKSRKVSYTHTHIHTHTRARARNIQTEILFNKKQSNRNSFVWLVRNLSVCVWDCVTDRQLVHHSLRGNASSFSASQVT